MIYWNIKRNWSDWMYYGTLNLQHILDKYIVSYHELNFLIIEYAQLEARIRFYRFLIQNEFTYKSSLISNQWTACILCFYIIVQFFVALWQVQFVLSIICVHFHKNKNKTLMHCNSWLYVSLIIHVPLIVTEKKLFIYTCVGFLPGFLTIHFSLSRYAVG